ncbi:MAG: 3-deoxy-manno-octulosonate cytidylyltransferase [Candidatus Syntrophosphaera sp.]|nr:3-deoxy-manno-octulosonate cytidylyltransferase [Candidatus Syntrophosphaera sp.]
MKAIAVIPARYASTRFPAKALAPLKGKPLILWVREAVSNTGLFETVLVATDSELIKSAVEDFGGKAVLTRSDHPSGTDRIAEASAGLDFDLIVNVQGDEPLITKDALAPLLKAFDDPSVRIASLLAPLEDPALLADPNIVKVVTDQFSNALYFSRAPIPWDRDGTGFDRYKRHIGVYAYRREALMRFIMLPPGTLEQVEKLEQLRALENGIPIRMVETAYQGIGIDTPEDLERVELLLRASR